MKIGNRWTLAGLIIVSALFFLTMPAAAQFTTSATAIDQAHRMQPAELARMLQSKGEKPLVLQVGPRTMYAQAHIPGAEFMGGASSDAGRARLRDRLKSVPHNRAVVLYCGCCPWEKCPNVAPALQEAQSLGFTNVKVLYIANNFGADWVDKGYPVAKGEQ